MIQRKCSAKELAELMKDKVSKRSIAYGTIFCENRGYNQGGGHERIGVYTALGHIAREFFRYDTKDEAERRGLENCVKFFKDNVRPFELKFIKKSPTYGIIQLNPLKRDLKLIE